LSPMACGLTWYIPIMPRTRWRRMILWRWGVMGIQTLPADSPHVT